MAPVDVRPATAADVDTVLAVVAEAFGPEEGPTVARLVEALAEAHHVRASLVAEVDGQVVGHVQLSRSWVDAARELVEVLVLSPLSVAPAWHGRGIGTALLTAAVAEARRLGAPVVFLEGTRRSTVRVAGHRPDAGLHPAPRCASRRAAFQAVVLEGREDWMTGALVCCDPFWALDCVGLR